MRSGVTREGAARARRSAVLVAAMIALASAGAAEAKPKVIKVPGTAANLTEACAMAAPGDTVSLAPGTYSRKATDEKFPIMVQKPIVIRGTADSTQVVIVPDQMKSAYNYTEIAAFIVRDFGVEQPAVLSRLTFRKGGEKKSVAIDVYGCRISVEGCVFSGLDTGVRIGGDCEARVAGCATNSVETPLSVARGNVLFENNTIRGAKKGMLFEYASGIARKNRILTPSVDGMALNRSDDVQIIDNVIENAPQCGISLRASSPLVRGNELTGNKYSIWCTDKSAPEIKANVVRGSRSYDVGLENGASPVIGGAMADANLFYGDGRFLVNNLTDYAVDARYNYWGTECPKSERFTGQVTFAPWVDREKTKELSKCR